MAEALDTRGARRRAPAADAAEPTTIAGLPKELLVSIFMAVGDPTRVRYTIPLVCKEWNEIYRSKDASPLHETLEVDFQKEVERAKEERRRRVARPLTRSYRPVVHASSVIPWAQGRADSVRKLRLVLMDPHDEVAAGDEDDEGDLKDFSSGDLAALIAAVGPSLTEIEVAFDGCKNGRYEKQFWKSLRDFVVRKGPLRSLVVEGIGSAIRESDVGPIGQLAGSLEELKLQTLFRSANAGLSRFPESVCALKKLRSLKLLGHRQVTAMPAAVSSLKELEEVDLTACGLPSLPKELGELSRLTRLDLGGNENLGNAPQDEAFPAELRKLKSLRELYLTGCGLSAVPAFVRELKSLETLFLAYCSFSSLPKELGDLSGLTRLELGCNEDLGNRPQGEAFPAELGKMKSLRELSLSDCGLRTVPAFVGKLESLEVLTLLMNDLSSLPKELGELSRLTRLDLGSSGFLGNTPEVEAFPAELRKLKSLRELHLDRCGLRAVPAFVGELESLETLDLSLNEDLQFSAPLGYLIEGCPRLRDVRLGKAGSGLPLTPESRAHIRVFKAKLRAKNPNAKVDY